MLLGAAAIWGLSTCIIKDTVAVFPPAWLMGIRFFLAGILLLIVFRKRVAQCLNREMLVAGAIIGLVLAPAYLLNTSGLQFTTASKGTFLTGTYSIMVPFIAWAISKQRPTRYNIAAALLALAGIGFISFSGAGEVSLTFGIGEAIMLASAFSLVCIWRYRRASRMGAMRSRFPRSNSSSPASLAWRGEQQRKARRT